ncbi:acyl carrier protein [Cellulomonas phragmiteti]|uniref:Carrier domain-containing protein n=1 Tax=Cellulomonas phragmiteti TaxID=478780 RepID=A0ABQ4DS75_9CELL|nr:acyl carrier protein [Cellulomonas phragmiteti]GIG41811.1 hypothetical protein Cph01nite_35730 [Cellulomonas phragmiteti]
MTAQDVTRHGPGTGPEEIRAVVLRYLARYVDDVAVLDRERLISDGWLDSLAAIGLVAHLERSFGLEVGDEDLELTNFDSLDAVTALVVRKLAG